MNYFRMILYFGRLWGDHGQTSLEQARVCLINATATGTEILKNLILPGETSASYQTRIFFLLFINTTSNIL